LADADRHDGFTFQRRLRGTGASLYGRRRDRKVSMASAASTPPSDRRAVRIWLLLVAALIFAMVLVGGATPLTEARLSIVEWKPATGRCPPLNAAEWQTGFEKYQIIPQYQQMNRGMTLDEFKLIYWWEWTHRLLARLIAVAFLLPFLWFLWRGAVRPGLRGR